MAKPKLETTVHVRIEKRLLERIKAIAKEQERSDGSQIVFMLKDWLNHK